MKNLIKFIGVIIILIIICFIIKCLIDNNNNYIKLKDDWKYSTKNNKINGSNYKSGGINSGYQVAESGVVDSTIGFSTGGAKDINNFRDNVNNGYFPLQTDITYEGLFYDYYFDTSKSSVNKESKDMFYPSASVAVSKDPISGSDEYYVSIGLNSNIRESDFKRKKLNIVIALDISGSMGASFNNYYYDNPKENEKLSKSKMKVAEESINILINQLKPYDSFGVVLFDDMAYEAKPLNLVSDTDIEKIKEHILEIEDRGGTNFEAGYKMAMKLFDNYETGNTDEYENRIIVITDAMPNIGSTSNNELLKMIKGAQKNDINTTFIGVGVDFNSEVVKNITNVRGSNYYKVSSEKEFNDRMNEEFDYMVTPMIYDLNMELESQGYSLEKIYGTDDINSENSNTVMHVNTLFPSKSNNDGEVKGGVILLKLKKKTGANDDIILNLTYNTIDKKTRSSKLNISFKNGNYYDNSGIEKAIVLIRYTNAIKNWIEYERNKEDRYLITTNTGIFDCLVDEEYDKSSEYYYSENERVSVPLTVSSEYKDIFNKIKEYISSEMIVVNDNDLNKEIDILNKILSY